jgi:hypothetical protein
MFKILIIMLATTSFIVKAHSGGTDSSGCHAGSKPYHCHNSGNNYQKTNSYTVSKNDIDEKQKKNQEKEDLKFVVEMMIGAKYVGSCDFYKQINIFQKSTEMKNGNKVIKRLKEYEAARLNMKIDSDKNRCEILSKKNNDYKEQLKDMSGMFKSMEQLGYCGMYHQLGFIIENTKIEGSLQFINRFIVTDMVRMDTNLKTMVSECSKTNSAYQSLLQELGQ